jgi:hypothetical protein
MKDNPFYPPPPVQYPPHDDTKSYKLVLDMYRKVFDIPKHMRDNTGRLILPKSLLTNLIKEVCQLPENCTLIFDTSIDTPCCIHCNNIETVNDIRIRENNITKSLMTCYNELYNKILDDFGISLNNVLGNC